LILDVAIVTPENKEKAMTKILITLVASCFLLFVLVCMGADLIRLNHDCAAKDVQILNLVKKINQLTEENENLRKGSTSAPLLAPVNDQKKFNDALDKELGFTKPTDTSKIINEWATH
jgi:cell division protein FtsB